MLVDFRTYVNSQAKGQVDVQLRFPLFERVVTFQLDVHYGK